MGWGFCGTRTGSTPDRSYAPITFAASGNTSGTVISGSNVISTVGWAANFVGRIAQNTGESSADWLASVLTGSGSSWSLGTNSTQYAGQPVTNISGPNNWAPEQTVLGERRFGSAFAGIATGVELQRAGDHCRHHERIRGVGFQRQPGADHRYHHTGITNLSGDQDTIAGLSESG